MLPPEPAPRPQLQSPWPSSRISRPPRPAWMKLQVRSPRSGNADNYGHRNKHIILYSLRGAQNVPDCRILGGKGGGRADPRSIVAEVGVQHVGRQQKTPGNCAWCISDELSAHRCGILNTFFCQKWPWTCCFFEGDVGRQSPDSITDRQFSS